jgi:hypothetical protein
MSPNTSATIKATIDKYWSTLDNDMKIMVALSALKCDQTKLANSFSWACQVMAVRELDLVKNEQERLYQEDLIKQTITFYSDPKEKMS